MEVYDTIKDKAKQELANVSPSPSESDRNEQPGTASQHGNGNRQFKNFGTESQKTVDVTKITHIHAENRAGIFNRPETPPKPFATTPFSRDPDFVNRRNILDQINKRYSEPTAPVVLVGLGGVGKSQLAMEFAHRNAAKQPDTWVFWVHTGTTQGGGATAQKQGAPGCTGIHKR
ncbi:hypothetical protein B0T22DRAFT_436463 [Podospora appendiculata]|uniref:NB-ARC domain-containing protein n=1 Tax=Podospora appendiculata TaxID=314037 RepID=A0AAE1CGB6_9PEZI|nr:hypothetical protein B0T22DRAFT_436463 [Podospora appendiculata]